ncbi:MAG: FAD-binding oxidoreductase [Pseudomonadota bacterium]
MTLVEQLSATVGVKYVLRGDDRAAYLKDWRGQFCSDALAVVLPASTQEVAACVRLLADHNVGIVPQAGNTGLVGGSVATDGEVIINVSRLNAIRDVDVANNSMLIEAGVPLATARSVAAEHQRLFALDLSSAGSAQVGGNIATNAGGVNVLRYGTTRAQVLGLEVVLANGEVLALLEPLRKNTAGYDLKQLFIGSEGTLGLITAANMALFAQPSTATTYWVTASDTAQMCRFAGQLQARFGNLFSAMELVPQIALELALLHQASLQRPGTNNGAHLLLVADEVDPSDSMHELNQWLAEQLNLDLVVDVIRADSDRSADNLWAIRHAISDAQRQAGISIKHDIALPLSVIDLFITQCTTALEAFLPSIRIVSFGHLGDGNLHFNLSQPESMHAEAFREHAPALSQIVHDHVLRFGGTLCAEHGVGLAKRVLLDRQLDVRTRETMTAIKRALDPKGILNPGKVLAP